MAKDIMCVANLFVIIILFLAVSLNSAVFDENGLTALTNALAQLETDNNDNDAGEQGSVS